MLGLQTCASVFLRYRVRHYIAMSAYLVISMFGDRYRCSLAYDKYIISWKYYTWKMHLIHQPTGHHGLARSIWNMVRTLSLAYIWAKWSNKSLFYNTMLSILCSLLNNYIQKVLPTQYNCRVSVAHPYDGVLTGSCGLLPLSSMGREYWTTSR
jgi:hypothetical protein